MKKADRVWRTLVALVMDTRDPWRRAVTEATGLPFSRVRALRRVEAGPLSLGELAQAMSCDAPAATVAINELERRGLVARRAHPEDRRAKLVVLTARGHRMLALVASVEDPAPPRLTHLSDDHLDALERVLR